MTSHLPETVFVGAQLGPMRVELTQEMLDRYRAIMHMPETGTAADSLCPPPMLEAFMSRLAVERFRYLQYPRFHARTVLTFARPIPAGTAVTFTGMLIH